MTNIAIILGSTRPNRIGEQVAAWVHGIASRRTDASYQLIDLLDHPLPHLDEPLSPSLGQHQQEHTKAWASTIASFDGFVMITPEYNGYTSSALKNAIDYLHAEWQDKSVGLISYGITGGTGAAAQLRQMCGQLGSAVVPSQVRLMLSADFDQLFIFSPAHDRADMITSLLDQVVYWSDALAPRRSAAAACVSLDTLEPWDLHREDLEGAPDASSRQLRDAVPNLGREALLADSISTEMLRVFGTLTPPEGLAFALHDIFAMPFEQIGPIVDRSPDAARELASRARKHFRTSQPDPSEITGSS